MLVLGVYLSDREHLAAGVAAELARSERWTVRQRWVALGERPPPPELAAVTTRHERAAAPKFTLVNRLLAEERLDESTYVLLSDDDIRLPQGFLDRYLDVVERHRFALAQPARSHDSSIDHGFVERIDGIEARWTRFVEIGPLLSIHRSAFGLLLPFDERSPMGWGYDLAWPACLEPAGLRLGIVDAVPVEHKLRPQAALYSHTAEQETMRRFLAASRHLARSEAFTILESYAEGEA